MSGKNAITTTVPLDQKRSIALQTWMNNMAKIAGAVVNYGSTNDRPANPYIPQTYFDTTLNQPIWWDGTMWVNGSGTGAGGTVTEILTGLGLNGGPITSTGTIAANVATTSKQGITKLIDSITSTDTGNAATANAVFWALKEIGAAPGLDQQIIFNQDGELSASPDLYFDYNFNVLYTNEVVVTGIAAGEAILTDIVSPAISTFANGVLVLPNSNLNFINSATVNVSLIANGSNQINISFSTNSSAAFPVFVYDTFAGSNGQSMFFTSAIIPAANDVIVSRNGLIEEPNVDYTTSGSEVILTTPAVGGESIQTRNYNNAAFWGINFDTFTATGGQTLFTMSANANNGVYVLVTRNGLLQDPTNDYVVVNNAVTLTTGAANGESIQTRNFTGANVTIIYNTYTATGGQTLFTMSQPTTLAQNIFVTRNGLLQSPGDDYTALSTAVSLTLPAVSGESVQIRNFSVAANAPSVYEIFTGLGLTGGPIIGSGTISINTNSNLVWTGNETFDTSNSSPVLFIANSVGNAAIAVNNSANTGTGTATFNATNKPGTNKTSPDKWLYVTVDGVPGVIPWFAL